ncbi:MAG TPA: hypothetical protein PL110_07730 [Candidatus Eremiobacteraeota bacterium]|nr:MAG: hypothetical protein BWY64_00803 [bacterium ADurb.Bin363]HPZ07987.1 hypothetical protein [Candidatus Eremiobacteraeota bacterium]
MGMLEDSAETAKMYVELSELKEKKREYLMESGLKGFELFKRRIIESDSLHRLSDDITDINNAIQVAAQEAKLEKKRELLDVDNSPQWKKLLDDILYKLIVSAERMEAKRRYEFLVIRGQDLLEDAGKISLSLAPGIKELEEVNSKVREVDRKLNSISDKIQKREKEGKAGISMLVSLISFISSFTKFFKTKL